MIWGNEPGQESRRPSLKEAIANRLLTEPCDDCGCRPATRQFENGKATNRFACVNHGKVAPIRERHT